MKALLIVLTLLFTIGGCKPDLTECKEASEDWMKAQCEKEPNGSACPEHERYEENRMVLVYNCQRGSQ
ncbi:MAG: hypothetical protein VX252_00175 [Myxococcota bacterium]|nr:hypothetical protein [Myxococcota bacterium]